MIYSYDLNIILIVFLIILVMGLYIYISVIDTKVKKLIEEIKKSKKTNPGYQNQNYPPGYNRGY